MRLAGGTGMPITPRERLARVLDGSQAPGAFSAQLSVSARDVRLAVAGARAISLPVRAPQAKRMIASARPSRFGRADTDGPERAGHLGDHAGPGHADRAGLGRDPGRGAGRAGAAGPGAAAGRV